MSDKEGRRKKQQRKSNERRKEKKKTARKLKFPSPIHKKEEQEKTEVILQKPELPTKTVAEKIVKEGAKPGIINTSFRGLDYKINVINIKETANNFIAEVEINGEKKTIQLDKGYKKVIVLTRQQLGIMPVA
jgi:hypothetical protein